MRRRDAASRERDYAVPQTPQGSDQSTQQTPRGPPLTSTEGMHQGYFTELTQSIMTKAAPLSTEQFSAKDVNRILMEFLMYLGRVFLLCYPIYLTGSVGLSISWILLSLLLWTMWKNNRKWKDVRLDSAVNFLENERLMVDKELKDLPAWVRIRPASLLKLNELLTSFA